MAKNPTLSPIKSAQAMVSAAVTAQRSGDSALAEQFLLQALEIHPRDPDALQLYGLMLKGKGDLSKAEQAMRKSLEIDGRQPHVHHNLANLLRARGAVEDALWHYNRAIQLSPDYVDALIQFGETMSALARYDEGEGALRKAYRLRPNSVAATVALAFLCGKTGKVAEAEQVLRNGLKLEPDNLYYRNNLGQLLTQQLRYDEAAALFAVLVAQAPRSPEIFLNYGNALLGQGKLTEAVDCYLKVIDLDPANYHAHQNLNDVLWQLGRKEDIGKSHFFAKQAIPDNADILEMSAECMISFGRLDEAEEDLRAAAQVRPRSPWQYRLWSALKLAQTKPDDAIAIAREGLQHNPDDLDLLGKLTEAAFLASQPQEALAAAQRMEQLDPINQFAACYQATALRMLGRNDEAHRIYDYERLVHAVELTPPDGFTSMADFNRLLAEKLDEMHHAVHEPVHQSLRNGTQTHESLFTRPGIDPAISQLGGMIKAAAAAFVAGLPDDRNHPFMRRKAATLDWVGSWSVRLQDGGFHVDHVHGKGWISGAYYVETPDCLADEEAKPGWIKFGQFHRAVGMTLPWEKAIRPRPGLLVLFPSYMLHGTLPITGSQPRLVVSFDIIPAGVR